MVCADIDARKVERLKANDIPIYEPGLEEMVRRNQVEERLRFTTDVGAAVEGAQVVFIAVGTPPDEDGSADLQHVLAVARTIGRHMNGSKVVVTKSTVPGGHRREGACGGARRRPRQPFWVCSNPEFLKEGAAIDDFMKPDRIVVGVDAEEVSRGHGGALRARSCAPGIRCSSWTFPPPRSPSTLPTPCWPPGSRS